MLQLPVGYEERSSHGPLFFYGGSAERTGLG